jgi:hypothetical protein
MHCTLQVRDGEFVGRIQAGLCGDEDPGADAGILGAEMRDIQLNEGKQRE